jgi:hypothetical protein
MKTLLLSALLTIATAGASNATPNHSRTIENIVKNLDLTSFPNSTGPRRLPGKTTLADYGFVKVVPDNAETSVYQRDRSWVMSFRIISEDAHSVRICFHDRGLSQPNSLVAPSYNATSALLISKSPRGPWKAAQVPAGFPSCENDPVTT